MGFLDQMAKASGIAAMGLLMMCRRMKDAETKFIIAKYTEDEK